MEAVEREQIRFNRRFEKETWLNSKDKPEEVDEKWLQEAVKKDNVTFENSISQAVLDAQELLDDGKGTYDSGLETKDERGAATPQAKSPVSYSYARDGTGGNANGSFVDEKTGSLYKPCDKGETHLKGDVNSKKKKLTMGQRCTSSVTSCWTQPGCVKAKGCPSRAACTKSSQPMVLQHPIPPALRLLVHNQHPAGTITTPAPGGDRVV